MTTETLTHVDDLLETSLALAVASKLSDQDAMFIVRLKVRRRKLGEGMLKSMTVGEWGRLTSLVEEA